MEMFSRFLTQFFNNNPLQNLHEVITMQNNLSQAAMIYNEAFIKLMNKIGQNKLFIDIGSIFYKKFTSINTKFWLIPQNASFAFSNNKIYEAISSSYKELMSTSLSNFSESLSAEQKPIDRLKICKIIIENYNMMATEILHLIKNYKIILESHEVKILNLEEVKFLEFCYKQIFDAFRPTNFIMCNPEVIEKISNTLGENLKQGASNLLKDVEESNGIWMKISTIDKEEFTVGENIACTSGAIIYKNHMMELIRYYPTKEKTYSIPIVICTAWINKYYILDLQEGNSFVRYLLDNGYEVFMISWVNPNEEYREISMEDYMKDGILVAIDEAIKVTKSKKVNLVGYCLGGTISVITTSYLKYHKIDKINSLILLTTLTHFEEAGEVSVFIDDQIISKIEDYMSEKGYLDSDALFTTFSILKASDMLWYYFVNNYLLGGKAMRFDILYWNADSTRLPYKMHKYYLRNFYQNNRLIIPNALTFCNTPIDISNIEVPIYNLTAKDDHISPWKSVYKGHKIYTNSTRKRIVLTESGHVSGVVNPASKTKYSHFVLDNTDYNDPEEWFNNATKVNGSWWKDLINWLDKEKLGGALCAARTKEEIDKEKLAPAPGNYVKQK